MRYDIRYFISGNLPTVHNINYTVYKNKLNIKRYKLQPTIDNTFIVKMV